MITTFFGAKSFGGDSVLVEHLSRALLRRGHHVEVIHSDDAFEAVRDGRKERLYSPPAGLQIHAWRSGAPLLSSLWSHQTSRLGAMRRFLQPIIEAGRFDVIHFHNVSLIGGAEALTLSPVHGRPIKLMTVHDYWLLCPLSSLWKFDREPCESRQCLRCTLHRGRPPQWWRYSGALNRALGGIDALLFPSRHALETHRRSENSIQCRRFEHMPNFLPEDWASPAGAIPSSATIPRSGRPYFAVAGRLVREKGFQRLIPLMAHFPGIDLVIAGAGRSEGELRRLASGLDNVQFPGVLGFPELAELYRGALAVIVPSLFYETFGYVAAEAMSVGTPVIAHQRGALPELVTAAAGLTYRTEEELLAALRRIASDPASRDELSAKGSASLKAHCSEETHIDRYLSLIRRIRDEASAS
jgi:glycosyltransferase involved in cell wall biosynthesis